MWSSPKLLRACIHGCYFNMDFRRLQSTYPLSLFPRKAATATWIIGNMSGPPLLVFELWLRLLTSSHAYFKNAGKLLRNQDRLRVKLIIPKGLLEQTSSFCGDVANHASTSASETPFGGLELRWITSNNNPTEGIENF